MSWIDQYLFCTPFVDCDSAAVVDTARSVTAGLDAEKDRAVAIYYFVRDRIRHNPYAPCMVPEDYRASTTLERGNGFCQHKAILLVALARAIGMPARIGLVDVRDHLLSPRFREMIGGDNLLIQHGYAELYVNGKWLHVSPAYDLDTCNKAGFAPVDFDGMSDARDPAYDQEGRRHIEHVKDHGHFGDFPLDYVREYQREWVSRIGREWNEFTDNVKRHEVA
jgi:transglutaminase-like putative cysteine protease